jgi:chitinase
MFKRFNTLGFKLSVFAAATVTAIGCSVESAEDESLTDQRADELVDACAGVPAWAPNVAYAVGALVTYQGKEYKVLQAHTSLSTWTPDVVPALFQQIATCGTSTTTTSASSSSSTSGAGGAGGSTTTSTTTSTTAGAGGAGGGTATGTEFAPYFYTWGWNNSAYPFTSLTDMKAKSGVSAATLAFVLSNGGCAVTQDIQQNKADVDAFVAGGGRIKASFGGANGTYLESATACSTASALAQAIKGFVTSTGIKDLDFDVEEPSEMNATTNERRAQALKSVQDQLGIKVAFTLPSFPRDVWGTPGGMSAAGVDVVKAAVAAGVKISHVNLMTMDFGGYYSNGKAMGDLTVSALTDANAQLRSIIPGLTEAAAYAMLGATPMIGQNDVTSEVFTLTDAQTVASFAKLKHLGLVSFWAINRDQPGSGSLALYSGVNTSKFQFSNIFKTVQ